jgi:hypothetical protein
LVKRFLRKNTSGKKQNYLTKRMNYRSGLASKRNQAAGGSNLILKDRNLIIKRAYPYELVAKISPSVDWLDLSGSTEVAEVSGRRQAPAFSPGNRKVHFTRVS